jgi:hypothetical protein
MLSVGPTSCCEPMMVMRSAIRFSGKALSQTADIAHADVRDGLPPPAKWRRREA